MGPSHSSPLTCVGYKMHGICHFFQGFSNPQAQPVILMPTAMPILSLLWQFICLDDGMKFLIHNASCWGAAIECRMHRSCPYLRYFTVLRRTSTDVLSLVAQISGICWTTLSASSTFPKISLICRTTLSTPIPPSQKSAWSVAPYHSQILQST